jgi:soluble lytic murein transglycosylase-like protein
LKHEINSIIASQKLTRPAIYFGKASSAGNGIFNTILNSHRALSPTESREHNGGLTAADYLANRVHLKAPKYVSVSLPFLKNKANKNYGKIADLNRPVYKKKAVANTSAVQKTESPASNPVFESNNQKQQAGASEPRMIERSITKAAAKYSLPPGLIKAVIRAESNFDAQAISTAGAQGLMQLMPATAEELGVQNPFDIDQNVDGGSRYLREMLDRFNGDVKLALAAYNAGPGTVEKYDGDVPYRETRNYVNRVMRFSSKYT